MKELDFDELDKAVNSLMGGSRPVTTPEPSPSIAEKQNDSPAVTSSSNTAAASVEPTSRSAVLPTKRSGRFMDVVHPSSDMRTSPRQTTNTERSALSSYTPPTLTPSFDPAVTKVDAGALESGRDTKETVGLDPLSANHEEASTSSVDHEHNWPDPLELAGDATTPASIATPQDNEDVVEQPSTSPREDQASSEEAAAKEEVDEDEDINIIVNDSPFLSDAKVEKRPLNSTGLSTTQEEVNKPEISESISLQSTEVSPSTEQDIQTDEPKAPNPTPLPAELSPGLLSLEAATPQDETPHEVEKTSSADLPAGPVSIVQQYKQQPRSGDQTHAAVYDHAAEPLAHPVKQKSGWLVPVIILLIVLLCGGGAGALFFLGYL